MKNLLNILTNPEEKSSIWVLNIKYCPDKNMVNTEACVEYTRKPLGSESPFSLDAIKDMPNYNEETYIDAYDTERIELIGPGSPDSRREAAWKFYHKIKKGDVIIYGYGNTVLGYYTVVDRVCNHIENENSCVHSWKANLTKFAFSMQKDFWFTSPFFMEIKQSQKDAIVNAIYDEINRN